MIIYKPQAPQHDFQSEPVWTRSLLVKESKFLVEQLVSIRGDRLPSYSATSDAECLCWRASRRHFAGHSFNSVESFNFPVDGWSKDQGSLSFRLSDFKIASAPADAAALGVRDEPGNPLLELQHCGKARVLVPTLTLLAALVFATPSIQQSLLCPGDFGFVRNDAESTSDLLVIEHTGDWPIGPMHIRAVECLAFWLEAAERRASLETVFFAAYEGAPAVLPELSDEVFRYRFTGYRRNATYVLELLGQLRGVHIWERSWRRCEVRSTTGQIKGWSGEPLSSLSANARAA